MYKDYYSNKENIEEEIVEMSLEPILYELLVNGDINETHLDDIEKLLSIIAVKGQEIFTDIDEKDFIPVHTNLIYASILELADQELFIPSIILISTTIEHEINIFYRTLLCLNNDFDNNEITKIIKNTKLDFKLTWLIKLATNEVFNPEIRAEIIKLMNIRNSLVHEKFIPYGVENRSERESLIANLDIGNMLSLPLRTERELNRILYKKIPLLRIAREMKSALLDFRQKNL